MTARQKHKLHEPPTMRQTAAFLVDHFGRRPGMVAAAFGFMALASSTSVVMPLFWGGLVDAAGGARRISLILPPILAIVLLSVFYHITLRMAHFLNCHTDTRVHAEIAAEAVRHVHSFETDWHTNTFAGSIVTAVKRGRSAAHRLYDTICYDLWPAVLVVAGSIVVAWGKSPLIAVSLVAYAALFTSFSVVLSFRYVAPKKPI
jgi:ABC-type bacteriocin/lantibiotic exporter with double-glycine peptidase domain